MCDQQEREVSADPHTLFFQLGATLKRRVLRESYGQSGMLRECQFNAIIILRQIAALSPRLVRQLRQESAFWPAARLYSTCLKVERQGESAAEPWVDLCGPKGSRG